MFGMWETKARGKKVFFHQTETLLEEKISTTTNKKSKTNTNSIFNTRQSNTGKKHKTQTKIKQTSRYDFLETKQIKKIKIKPISFCFPTFSRHLNTKQTQPKKKNLKIMYIFREHTKIRKNLFPFAFLHFLSTQTPSTKQTQETYTQNQEDCIFFFFG